MSSRLPIVEEPDEEAISRRTFLEYLGASLSVAGLAGCKPEAAEKIVPWSSAPPELIPGVPISYATSMELDGYAVGLLVSAREGRPIKIEGHPDHPSSMGAAGPFQQASLMDLYHPRRAQGVLKNRSPSTWNDLIRSFTSQLGDGEGLCFLCEPTSSPLLASLFDRIRRTLPRARIYFHGPFAPHGRWQASRELFGRALIPEHRFERADVILSLDADFLSRGPSWLADARRFASRRRPGSDMSRLYVAECGFTTTGAKADHRIALRSRDLIRFARSIASGRSAIAADLFGARGRSIVIAGDRQPKEVHALAMELNHSLGNAGKTIVYRDDPIIDAGDPSHELSRLQDALSAGRVRRLVILGGNPVYTIPGFARSIAKIETAYLGLFPDETSEACRWFAGETHYLESWGDSRAADGTISMIQPLIRPLFGGRTRAQLLAAFSGEPDADPRELLARGHRNFDEALRSGMVPNSANAELAPSLGASSPPSPIPEVRGLELALMPSPTLYDGRFADNPWLQELPDPMARLCWGNAALIAPRTAERLGLSDGDAIRISAGDRSADAPISLLPGMPEDSLTLALGHGRLGIGTDAYPLRLGDRWFADIQIERLPDPIDTPARVQEHSTTEGRTIILTDPRPEDREDPPSILPDWPEEGRQWGMAIDLNACVGCNACVVACQAENNVPVVGKINVEKSREMHWLRLDRYYVDGGVVHQPMLCQHCEKAPCEYVCPVNATVHSPDGLNEMVYNRCVGTRFCSNNCPYKVRRFNWFDFNRDVSEVEALHFNPDVTVRARGVMEKCTYCVQRIRRAEIAGVDEVVTACQQACPAEAIVFGDVADPTSRVSQLHRDPRTYSALNELGTRPRTKYLAPVRNRKVKR